MERRGPGNPWSYVDPIETNRRAAAGHNIQASVQASANAGLIQAENLNQLKQVFGSTHYSTHYKLVTGLEWCYKLEKVFMALDMLMNVEEAKISTSLVVWLTSISARP